MTRTKPMEPVAVVVDDPKQRVLEILEEHRLMVLATLRPDGWPQATTVGYIYDDLTLYCAVARTSQKFENIRRDSRVSVAIAGGGTKGLHGLSMAARATESTDPQETDRVNRLLWTRYSHDHVFSPRSASAAVLKITPILVSLIDLAGRDGQPRLLRVGNRTFLEEVVDQAPAR